MSPRSFLLVISVAFSFVAGCAGGPQGEGQSKIDGTLARRYDMTLVEAYDAVVAFAEHKQWRITDKESDRQEAEVNVETPDELDIEFALKSSGPGTEVGIEYDGGNRIESIRLFEELEPRLPGPRIR